MGVGMQGKRAALARVVRTFRLDTAKRAVERRFGANKLTVIAYHRVNDPGAADRFDEGTLDVFPERFGEQVRLLKQEYTLVDPVDVRACLRGKPWPRRPAMITFDDGYRDNYERALPILENHGAKALFFIATHYIDHRNVYWWDRISYTLKHATKTTFTIEYPTTLAIDVGSDRSRAESALHSLVKTTFDLDLSRFLEELTTAAGVAWSDALERELADELVMTWDHVRALRDAGMRIGSHTRTHRVLGTIKEDQLRAELSGSRSDLEDALGEEVWSIAYPVGYPVVGDRRIRAALREAGYEIGFTYNTGAQDLRSLDPFDVSRSGVDVSWDLGRFSAVVEFPALA